MRGLRILSQETRALPQGPESEQYPISVCAQAKQTSASHESDDNSALNTKTDFKLHEKVRKQRNRLAHGEEVSINDVLVCVQVLQKILNGRGRQLCAAQKSNEDLAEVEECLFVLNHLASWRKRSVRLSVHLPAKMISGVTRLALHIEQNLVGRNDTLDMIVAMLLSPRTGICAKEQSCGDAVRVLIHGPPGIGKTALVRNIANLTRHTFPVQHIFQATTECTLAMDISCFFRSTDQNVKEFNKGSVLSSFESVIDRSSERLLLIFEDVRDPSMIMSLLPKEKHCVLFTSLDDFAWRKAGIIPDLVTPVHLSALGEEESLELLETILTSKGKKSEFHNLHRTPVAKKALVSFLTENMLGLPLAIRLFAFQLCLDDGFGDAINVLSTSKPVSAFSSMFNELSPSHRLKIDEKAAGRDHIRGFHHVVQFAMRNLHSEGGELDVCFLVSLLPPGKLPLSFVERVCHGLGISTKALHQSLSSLSNRGLVTREPTGWKMHQVIQSLVLNKQCSRDSCSHMDIVCAFVQTINEATLGCLDKPLMDIDDNWRDVFESGDVPECCVHKTFLQQLWRAQVEEILSHFLDLSSGLHLGWEDIDLCLRCLLWCRRTNTYGEGMEEVQAMIAKNFALSKMANWETWKLSDFTSKERYLNVLSARWKFLYSRKTISVSAILFDLETVLLRDFSIDLKELLECVSTALLPVGIQPFDDKRAGKTVLRVFAEYGLSSKLLSEWLDNAKENVSFRVVLLYCRALGESGQLHKTEYALRVIVQTWNAKWRLFNVSCKELLLHVILSYSMTVEEMEKCEECMFWNDTAFQINSSCTDTSSIPHLSLLACLCASKAVLRKALAYSCQNQLLENIREVWISRIRVFLNLPILSSVSGRLLFHSVFKIFLSLVMVENFAMAPNVWKLLVKSFWRYQLARRFSPSMELRGSLFILLFLTCAVERKSDLNLSLVKSCCKLIVQYCREEDIHHLIFEHHQVFMKLTQEQKSWLFNFVVALVRHAYTDIGTSEKNPFSLSDCERRPTKPDPGVIREVINLLIAECRYYGRESMAKSLTEAFKTWPSD